MADKTIGIKFGNSDKTYHYFVPEDSQYAVNDSFRIYTPHGIETIRVAEINISASESHATKFLNPVDGFITIKCSYAEDNGFRGEYAYTVIQHDSALKKDGIYHIRPNNAFVKVREVIFSKHKKSRYSKIVNAIDLLDANVLNIYTRLVSYNARKSITSLIGFEKQFLEHAVFANDYSKLEFRRIINAQKEKYEQPLITPVIYGKDENRKEENKMNKLFGNLTFGKINTNEIKFSVAGLAFRNAQGGYAVYNAENNEMTDVTGMTMDTDFVFAMPVAIKDIEVGDIVRHMGKFVVVKTKYEDGSIAAIDPVAAEEKTILPVKNVFGFNYYSKVLNLFAGIQPTGDNPFGDMNAMLPFLIMSEGSNNDALMLAMAMQNTDLAANPMLMYALMNK
jgi:hypothetical protein